MTRVTRGPLSLSLAVLAFVLCTLPAAAQPGIEVPLAADALTRYTYTVPANQVTVITLKHLRGGANFDFAVTRPGGDTALAGGQNSGIATELDFVAPAEFPQEIEIFVRNQSGVAGTYRLITHEIDLAGLLAEATGELLIEEFIRHIMGVDSTAQGQQLDRAVTGAMSLLSSQNLSQVGENVLLAEIESFIANEVGTGVFGRFAFKVLVRFVEQLFYYY